MNKHSQITSDIDDLGNIRAQLSELRKQEAAIEARLKHNIGEGSADGFSFHITVSKFVKETVSWKDIAAKFKPSSQLIVAHTNKTDVTRITLTARLAEKLAA